MTTPEDLDTIITNYLSHGRWVHVLWSKHITCGLLHDEPMSWQDCPVAGRWTLMRTLT
jgi:hypothetical protein